MPTQTLHTGSVARWRNIVWGSGIYVGDASPGLDERTDEKWNTGRGLLNLCNMYRDYKYIYTYIIPDMYAYEYKCECRKVCDLEEGRVEVGKGG